MKDSEIKYSTVQNWYPGDKEGKGGIYNFVTKRGLCFGDHSKISWTQSWKPVSMPMEISFLYFERRLLFRRILFCRCYQQLSAGRYRYRRWFTSVRTPGLAIVSKGISAGKSQNSYRGQVHIMKRAQNARNFSQCDSLLMGDQCGAHTFPYIDV